MSQKDREELKFELAKVPFHGTIDNAYFDRLIDTFERSEFTLRVMGAKQVPVEAFRSGYIVNGPAFIFPARVKK